MGYREGNSIHLPSPQHQINVVAGVAVSTTHNDKTIQSFEARDINGDQIDVVLDIGGAYLYKLYSGVVYGVNNDITSITTDVDCVFHCMV